MTANTSSVSLLSAVVATTTSSAIRIGKAYGLALQFTAASITAGNGVFTVEVSADNTNWISYNRLISNVTNTNSQHDTRVASVTLSSNTSAMVFFPSNDLFDYIRVTVTRTTDGTYSAKLLMREEG